MRGPTEPGYRVAHAVGMTINPLVLPPLFFIWVLLRLGWPVEDVTRAATIVGFFLTLVPLGALLWMLRSGLTDTIEVRSRARRGLPFVAALVGGLSALAIALSVTWPTGPIVEPLLACLVLNTVLLAAINLRFKISLHAATIAGFVAMSGSAFWLAGLSVTASLVIVPLIALVMWARVRTGAHTAAQVVAGALFGLVVPTLQMMILARAGLLVVG